MKPQPFGIFAVITLAGATALRAEAVFTDTFNYTTDHAFIAQGGWTSLVPGGNLGDNFGAKAGESKMWGNPTGGAGTTTAGIEYNYATALAAGETITMNATILRGGGYSYGMRVFLWDGSDPETRTQVAGGTQAPAAAGALTEVSYTVSAANTAAGLDHVIFRYSHDNAWGETNDVTFGVNPAPDGWVWTNPAGGSWATPGDWTPDGPADGADQAALINLLDIAGDQTITLDGGYTIGTLRFGDAAGNDGNWILNPGLGKPLILSAPADGFPGVIVGNQSATVNAVLTGSEGMTKTGSGTLVFGAANTYTGGTFIKAGTLRIGHLAAIPSGVDNGDVTLTGTLDLNDTSITLNALTGTGAVTNSGTGTPTLTLGGDDANGSFGGTLGNGSGTTSVLKTGAGVQILTGNNTLAGTLTAEGGILVVSGQAATNEGKLRNVRGVTAKDGATVELGAENMFVLNHSTALSAARVLAADGGDLRMNSNMISRIGNVSLANGALWTVDRELGGWDILLADTDAGAATVTVANTGGNTTASLIGGGGGIHLQGSQNFAVDDVTGDAMEDLEISLILAGPGDVGGAAGAVNKLGSGTLLVSGSNTYKGNTTVGEGTLVLGDSGALTFVIGTDGVSNKVTGEGTAILNGRFDLNRVAANMTTGNTWTLVDTTTTSYGPNFEVAGFTADAGIHSLAEGGTTWTFTEATGVLTVSKDYDVWATGNAYWVPGDPNSQPTADYDNDGVKNQAEYAFGLNPTRGSSVSPLTPVDRASGTFTYTRRNPALSRLAYSYEWSTTLAGASWTAVVPAVADGIVTSGNSQTVTVDLTGAPGDPLANAALFVRVKAD